MSGWWLPPVNGVAGVFTTRHTPSPVADLLEVRQVHGTVVRDAADAEPTEADAIVATRDASPGARIAIRVADCLPVLLVDADAGVIAAAHAGRVGLLAGVLPATLAAMRNRGARDVRAWIGPHICGPCYEVPPAMYDDATSLLVAVAARTTRGTPALDLAAGACAQLAGAGVPTELMGPCTRETADLHSYRRDGDAAGRQRAIVWFE